MQEIIILEYPNASLSVSFMQLSQAILPPTVCLNESTQTARCICLSLSHILDCEFQKKETHLIHLCILRSNHSA